MAEAWTMKAQLARSSPELPLVEGSLREAFQKFSEASGKLEAKYELLKTQVLELRGALRQKDEELKRSARLAMLGETAAVIAHEVRNPLGALTLFISLLHDEVKSSPRGQQIVQQMEKSIDALSLLVNNILQFSRTQKLTLAPCNLHSLITEQALAVEALPGTVKIELELTANPFISGNEAALRQIFHNLLMNAHQAMQGKGQVQIRTANLGEFVGIEIQDSGPGIPANILGTVFEPFVTTRVSGTGLGLAIVRQLVSAHGGTVRVENRGGASFFIELPRRGEASEEMHNGEKA